MSDEDRYFGRISKMNVRNYAQCALRTELTRVLALTEALYLHRYDVRGAPYARLLVGRTNPHTNTDHLVRAGVVSRDTRDCSLRQPDPAAGRTLPAA